MANKINYAEKWQPQILEILNQESLTSPFLASEGSVEFSGAKTVHFTQMSTSGFKNHSRDGGFNKGTVSQEDVDYTITHDRDVLFGVDKIDVDETNGTASIDNVSKVFVATQEAPEMDATFFENVYNAASKNSLVEELDMSGVTTANVVSKFKNMMMKGKLRRYRANGSLLCYVSTEFMNLLELSTESKLKVELTTVADGGVGIETRVTNIDGVFIFEVIDDERFYSKFDYSDGFIAADDAKKLAVVFASTQVVKTVQKTKSVYFYEPGEDTNLGDSYGYANRSMWDTFVFPNGKDGKIEGIFVAYEKVATAE